ncbi:ABC transporter permease [Dyella sp. LX-66]|uniref:ABC transporter permease n=1 Tax=unclassified Dyella TaxID=2634549 RepID=UPI001BE015A3|nr:MULTISPECIES: FtsX-like permease family protein [unclassified Dyella]MBT2115474.1 ABC transporter permease [Dyella sp. LX-1]MBT2139289.1 ABC transporter permease [Dyella sp. LX-66]
MAIRPILSTLRRHKTTALLVVLEIALTCAIVCNAVFLVSQRIERIHMPSGVAENELIQVALAEIGAKPDEHARTLTDLAALRAIPGVTEVSSVNQIPFGRSSNNSGIKLDPKQNKPTLNATNYFGENIGQTLGVQLVAGRLLQPEDYVSIKEASKAFKEGKLEGLPRLVVITEPMAQRLFPGQSALGKTIWLGSEVPLQIVGVVKNLVRPSIWNDAEAQYSMMVPMQVEDNQYLIRTAPGERERVLAAAIAAMKKNNPHRIFWQKRTWDEVRQHFFDGDRSMTGLLIGVCIALLVVTALGIVGLGSFWVAQRRRQIGVRRALGATRGHILRYFQTENFLLATIGIALGMVLAYGINLFLMVHYELPRLPAVYFPIGALALWLIGQAAVLGPAMRAAAVPPVVATRSV